MGDARPTPAGEAPRTGERAIAVALHGIEPATFERCALIRDWLGDHGIERATLLVIPARDMHPVGERSPAMIEWLCEQRRAGDSIAQHGFRHGAPRRAPALVLGRRRARGEFPGLDAQETRRAVDAGWRVLKLAGVEPDGFVAPAYAYTAALRASLTPRFRWWAELLRVHRTGERPKEAWRAQIAPAWSLAAAGPLRGVFAPQLVRAGSLLPVATLRLDIHPAYLQQPRQMLALEWVLARSARARTAVTYRDLAGA